MSSDEFVISPRRPAVGKSSVITVRFKNETLKQLEDVAKKTDRTRNEIIQMCMDYALEHLIIKTDEEK